MKDFLGNDITAGCKIVYPCRRGSDMWLSTMTVTSTEDGRIRGYSPTGYRVCVKNIQNVIVVPAQACQA
jgi:hypothetical protein